MQGFNTYYKIPENGSAIYIPRKAFIRYRNNVLRITHSTWPKTHRNIEKVVFHTGFNGTKEFYGSAPHGALYGGGEMLTITYFQLFLGVVHMFLYHFKHLLLKL